jgi:hypothetical protein
VDPQSHIPSMGEKRMGFVGPKVALDLRMLALMTVVDSVVLVLQP